MLHRNFAKIACTVVLASRTVAGNAQAKSHLWDMLRVFSNEQGNIQFIGMFVSDPAGTGEHLFGGRPLTSSTNSNTFIFPNDLPLGGSTFQTWVLIATQDYANLPGAPTPDYIIPANFFDPNGDELRYRNTIDIFTIPAGVMPTDGTGMLLRDLSTPVNVGTNFAGESGTVAAGPVAVSTLTTQALGIGALLLLLLGAWVLLRRQRTAPSV